jgi:CBS domain-containing protein
MANEGISYGGGDKLLFTITLEDLAKKNIITAFKGITIKEAAEKMSLHKISSLVLLDEDGFPEGIVTDRDLRDKVAAKGRDMNDPVSDIMSVTLIKAEADDYCFEALIKMIRYNIHHLLVLKNGEVRGMITNHDLMMLQGTSPLSIAHEIEGHKSIEGLAPVSKRINALINLLIKEEAKAGNVTRIITEINDRLLRKAIELMETRLGPPPAPYCWIVFGSEGRKEQTFKTDQDNAIIYEDTEEEEAKRYFTSFALMMKDALVKCGFPPCSADYMASNPMWRQPLTTWKEYFSSWINTPTPEAILRSLIFFDFRPVHGDLTLAEKLRAYLGHALKNRNIFLTHMAGEILKNRPPLGIWGNIAVEKSGEHKGKINIKMNAICPIVDAARLFALAKGVYNTSTVERLRALKNIRSEISEFCGDLDQAFEFFMSLRLRHQFMQAQEDVEPDNFIDPDELGTLEKKLLKESFKIVSKAQETIKHSYNTWMVS